MVSRLFLAAAALSLLPTAFGQAKHPGLQLSSQRAINVVPKRMAKCTLINGRVFRVSPWVKYQRQIPQINSLGAVAFDNMESDAGGNPVGDRYGADIGAGRWFFGSDYNNTFACNDLKTAPG